MRRAKEKLALTSKVIVLFLLKLVLGGSKIEMRGVIAMKRFIVFVLGFILFLNGALIAEAKDNVSENASMTEAMAVIAADTPEVVVQKPTIIVINGNDRYLQEEYQDILTRYFVKCYSQYRFPMTYGLEAQQDFYQTCSKVNGANDIHSLSQKEMAEVLSSMDKEQALFLNVHDRVYKTRRHWDWWFGAEDTWDAVVYLEATLVDKQGIISHKKYQYTIESQYTPGKALQDAYTRCIRQLQKSDIFNA